MAIDRATIHIGPGYITYNSASILSAEDITVTLPRTLFEVTANGYGVIDARKQDFQIQVNCTPLHWDNLATLMPYASQQIGTSIYGDTDKPLSIIPRSGANSGITLANAAPTVLPNITFSAIKPALGQMTFTGIIANNADPALTASYYTTAAVGVLPNPDLSKIPNVLYTASWGTVLQDFGSAEGFVIEPNLTTEDVSADDYGCVDKILTGLGCTVRVTPMGLTFAQILAALSGEGIGAAPAKNALSISGSVVGSPTFNLANAIVEQGAGAYGNTVKRVGELQFRNVRTANAGLLQPLWTIGTKA